MWEEIFQCDGQRINLDWEILFVSNHIGYFDIYTSKAVNRVRETHWVPIITMNSQQQIFLNNLLIQSLK